MYTCTCYHTQMHVPVSSFCTGFCGIVTKCVRHRDTIHIALYWNCYKNQTHCHTIGLLTENSFPLGFPCNSYNGDEQWRSLTRLCALACAHTHTYSRPKQWAKTTKIQFILIKINAERITQTFICANCLIVLVRFCALFGYSISVFRCLLCIYALNDDNRDFKMNMHTPLTWFMRGRDRKKHEQWVAKLFENKMWSIFVAIERERSNRWGSRKTNAKYFERL